MKTTCKKLKDNKVEVKVSFDKDEVNRAIANKYREIARKYNFPGFRKGKAPRPVVDSLLGKDGVSVQATDDLVNDNYPLSMDDANIFPVGKPDFDEDKMGMLKQGEPFTFTYNIEVEPTFELDNYDEVEIAMPQDTATKSEIENQLKQMTQYHYEFKDAPVNTKAAKDEELSLKIEAKDDDGKNIENLTNDNFTYHLGSKFLSEDFEKELVGHKAGDELKFKLKMPKKPPVLLASLDGKTKNIDFVIKVNAIKKKVMPKITDEWVKANMGFDTVEDFRKKIEEQINSDKKKQLPLLKENKAMAVLADRLQGDVPKSVVDAKEAELLQDFFTQLQQQGITMDQYLAQMQITSDKFKEDIKKQAASVAKQDLALDAYARNHAIEATDKDIEDEFKYVSPDKWKELYKDWAKRGELHTLRRAIVRMKAAKELVEKAKVSIESDDSKTKTTPKKSSEKNSGKANVTSKKQTTTASSTKTAKSNSNAASKKADNTKK